MSAGRIVGRERWGVVSQLECCGDPDVSGLIRAAALTQPLGGFPNLHPAEFNGRSSYQFQTCSAAIQCS